MAPPSVSSQSTNGVLQVPAAALQKQPPPSNTPRGPARPKSISPRLKVIIRRLPPGLTKDEFQTIMGEEWKAGGAKVDWFLYKPGKISKDLAKPSHPSLAYLHVTDQALLKTLSEHVLQLSFIDAKNSSKDPALVGPPSLEFSPYPRIPNGRKRNDARQATIDQDPEFIEFLQSLTNPIVKPSLSDSEGAAKKEVVQTTPLIEHLREKRAAAKEKPSAAKTALALAAKHGRQESKDIKSLESKISDTTSDSKSPLEKSDKRTAKSIVPSAERGKKLTKADKAARDAVKVLNREAATVTTPAAERRRERIAPAINIAAKIQRDLGLTPATGRRGRREVVPESQQSAAESSRENAVPSSPALPVPSTPGNVFRKEPRLPRGRRSSKTAFTEKEENVGASKKVPTGPAQPTILKKPMPLQPPKAPAAARQFQGPKAHIAPRGPAASHAATAPTLTPSAATPQPLNRQAFLKHANPSQGITEVLIEEALSAFGKVEKVEIDRKKGFAYVMFDGNETLRKACAAGSVKVAQGAVQILERRDRPAGRAVSKVPFKM